MLRARHTDRAGAWPQEQARGTVTLRYDDRHRRRFMLATDAGEPLLLDLPRPAVLEEGDGIALDDGGWIEVHAAVEPLLEVRAASAALLARLAWHIGNRHMPAQIFGDRILLHENHVVADMLDRLGASVRRVEGPFSPERGAYDGGVHHHSDHRHDDHGHEH